MDRPQDTPRQGTATRKYSEIPVKKRTLHRAGGLSVGGLLLLSSHTILLHNKVNSQLEIGTY